MGWHAPKCDAEYEAMLGVDLLDQGPRPPCQCDPPHEADEDDEPCEFCDGPAVFSTEAGHFLCAAHEAAYWRHINAKIDERRGK
jgi:hypothetical protein